MFGCIGVRSAERDLFDVAETESREGQGGEVDAVFQGCGEGALFEHGDGGVVALLAQVETDDVVRPAGCVVADDGAGFDVDEWWDVGIEEGFDVVGAEG